MNSISRHIFLSAFVIGLLCISTAPSIAWDLTKDRIFSGMEFMTLAPIKVYSGPTEESRIVDDIPRWHIIFAVPSKVPGWLQVNGAQMVDGGGIALSGLSSNKRVGVKNGAFVFPDERRVERDGFRSVSGFILSSSLASMDKNVNPSIASDRIQRAPDTWASVGLPERRFVPKNAEEYPFSAVALLVVTFSDGRQEQCSGFFIESLSLIGTAGHCVDPKAVGASKEEHARVIRETKVEVLVMGRDTYSDRITAHLIDYAYDDLQNVSDGEDWALLKLERQPTSKIQPIRLPSRANWQSSVKISVLSLGFPGDLIKVYEKSFGWVPVTGDTCVIPTTQFDFNNDADGAMQLSFRTAGADCVTWFGNSGGPLLVWNEQNNLFELVGILSSSEILKMKEGMEPDAQLLYRNTVKSLEQIYGKLPGNSEEDQLSEEQVYGAAYFFKRLTLTADPGADNDRWNLDRNFITAVSRALGTKDSGEAVLSSLVREGSNILGSSPAYPESKSASSNYLVVHGDQYRGMRLSFFNEYYTLPMMLPQNQQKLGLGDVLSVDELNKLGVPNAEFILIPWLYKLRPDSTLKYVIELKYLDEVRRRLTEELSATKEDDHIYAVNFALKQINSYKLVVVGGDLFEVESSSQRVVGVIRNWMNYIDVDPARVRISPYYDKDVEDPAHDAAPAKPNDLVPTDTLRSEDMGAETPTSIPGGHVISPTESWRRILAGFDGKDAKPIVLSAIHGFDGVPTAIDVSFASAGGDFSDATQSRLVAKMQDLAATKNSTVIVYCHHPDCWLSYNLALRLIHLGFTDVQWMRDGIDGWILQGLPMGFVH